ncbi:MAG: Hpt domain-containing protein [Holophagales bacterium]|nr:Hpt domain-containing protein [Holophagales bacterium]
MPHAELGIQQPDELKRVPVLDFVAIAHIFEAGDGETGLFEELMGIFQQDQPQRLEKLGQAVISGDLATIRDISHAIRGSAGTMGASRLRAAAGLLEAHSTGHPSAASPQVLFELLTRAYEEARLALGEYLEKQP